MRVQRLAPEELEEPARAEAAWKQLACTAETDPPLPLRYAAPRRRPTGSFGTRVQPGAVSERSEWPERSSCATIRAEASPCTARAQM